MRRRLDTRDRPAQIHRPGGVVQIVDRRMRRIIGAENLVRLKRFVRAPFVSDRHGAQDHTFLIAQGDVLAFRYGIGEFLTDIQRDRHRPERPIGQPHGANDAVVIFAPQKPLQRVEPAIHQQLQITNLARAQIPGGQVARVDFQLLGRIVGDIKLWDRGKDLHDMISSRNGAGMWVFRRGAILSASTITTACFIKCAILRGGPDSQSEMPTGQGVFSKAKYLRILGVCTGREYDCRH